MLEVLQDSPEMQVPLSIEGDTQPYIPLPPFEHPEHVRYYSPLLNESHRGVIEVAEEYSNPGDRLDWAAHPMAGEPHAQFMVFTGTVKKSGVTESGDTWLLQNNSAFNISAYERGDLTNAIYDCEENESLPTGFVGEPLNLSKDFATAPILKAAIYKGMINADAKGVNAMYQQRGVNPFEEAWKILKSESYTAWMKEYASHVAALPAQREIHTFLNADKISLDIKAIHATRHENGYSFSVTERGELTGQRYSTETTVEVMEEEVALTEPEQPESYEETLNTFIKARDEYARISAQRAKRSLLHGKKTSEKALLQAKKHYETSEQALRSHEVRDAEAAGATPEELAKLAANSEAENSWSLATAVYNQRLLIAGKARLNSSGELELVKPRTPIGRLANKFYNWYEAQDGKLFSKATLKKSAVMAAAGAVVGVPAAAAGSILLGPLAGGAAGAYLVGRVAKSALSNRVAKHVQGNTYNRQFDEQVQQSIKNDDSLAASSHVEELTSREITANRKRAAIAIGSAALGGFVGHFANGLFGSEHQHNLQTSHHSSPKPSAHSSKLVTGLRRSHHASVHHPSVTHPLPAKHIHSESQHGIAVHLTDQGTDSTVWGNVASHYHLTNNEDIYRVTDYVLRHNGLNWQQASSLNTGHLIHMPPPHVIHNLIEQLKAKNS